MLQLFYENFITFTVFFGPALIFWNMSQASNSECMRIINKQNNKVKQF